MSSKAKGVVALILVVAVLANVGIFAKMSYNKTHTAQETIVFRVGDTVASDHPISQALYMFEEELERISNGRFDVRVYINSALGGDRQQTESVILGYMQGNTPPTSVLAGFDTRFMVVDLPFVFKSGEAAMLARSLTPFWRVWASTPWAGPSPATATLPPTTSRPPAPKP